MSIFRGFNTIGRKGPPYTLIDADLVKRDLLNEFYTRLGERVMLPDFGTIIFDLLMEPGDSQTTENIKDDAIRIISKEPRVKLSNIEVVEDVKTVILNIEIIYAPYNLTDTLYVTYQRDAGV